MGKGNQACSRCSHDLGRSGLRLIYLITEFFKDHVVKSMAMGSRVIVMVLPPFACPVAAWMVIVLEWTVSGNGIEKSFGVVMMGYQVVSQER